jgi:hypothetical protein
MMGMRSLAKLAELKCSAKKYNQTGMMTILSID